MQAAIIPIVPAVRLDRIMLATDFSPASAAAIPIARLLASRYGAELTLAHIWSQPYLGITTPQANCQFLNAIEDAAREQLEALRSSELLKGIHTKSLLRYGDSVAQLADFVRSQRIDLLVVGTHGVTGVSRLLLGSVAEALIREVACPVLTVGPNLDPRFAHTNTLDQIVVPTDLTPHAHAVIPYLVPISAEFRSTIHLVHVLPEASRGDLTLVGSTQDKMQCECAEQFSSRTCLCTEIEYGDVVSRVLASAKAKRADLIAMGVRPAGLLTSHFRSTVSYNIMATAPCPVLTVKSDL